MTKEPHAKMMVRPMRVARLHARLFGAAIAGAVLLALLPAGWRVSTRLLISWDFGAFTYIALSAWVMATCDVTRLRRRAEEEDESAAILLMLIAVAALASFAAIVSEIGAARVAHSGEGMSFALAAITAALSWILIHVIFAFHYAHEFYGAPNPGTGLIFPQDDEPNYWDFVYFSFVVGMTFQVSDVQIASKTLRRIVVAHGALSFVFSVAILALTVNIGSNLI